MKIINFGSKNTYIDHIDSFCVYSVISVETKHPLK